MYCRCIGMKFVNKNNVSAALVSAAHQEIIVMSHAV